MDSALSRNQLRKQLDEMPLNITQKMVTMDQDQALRTVASFWEQTLETEFSKRQSVLDNVTKLYDELNQTKPRIDHQKKRVVYWQEQTYLAEDRLEDARFQIVDLERELLENRKTA